MGTINQGWMDGISSRFYFRIARNSRVFWGFASCFMKMFSLLAFWKSIRPIPDINLCKWIWKSNKSSTKKRHSIPFIRLLSPPFVGAHPFREPIALSSVRSQWNGDRCPVARVGTRGSRERRAEWNRWHCKKANPDLIIQKILLLRLKRSTVSYNKIMRSNQIIKSEFARFHIF